MAYLSETGKTLLKIEYGRIIDDSALLNGIIKRDLASKEKKEMREGNRYYEGEHDILNKNFQAFKVKGMTKINPNAANNKITNTWHTLLVDQKVDYIAGNPVAITVKDSALNAVQKEYERALNNEIRKFSTMLNKWLTGASNNGYEALHVFYNSSGEFDYTIINAKEIIPDYDEQTGELLSVIRYYKVDYLDAEGNLRRKYKAEVWNSSSVWHFIETDEESGVYIPDYEVENPQPHWKEYFSTFNTEKESKSWGRVPFIFLNNNDKRINDLRRIKPLIDVYDLALSDFANNLEDIQEAIWNLRGYEGTDLAEFLEQLKVFRVIKTAEDGGAEPHTLSIPTEAKEKFLNIIKRNIFLIGRGVDLSDEEFAGNYSGVALKFKFAGLDLKANQMIRHIQNALKEFNWFLTDSLNRNNNKQYNAGDVEFTINKALIINEKEIIESLNASKGVMSLKAVMAKHPYINNVEQNLKELEDEKDTVIN